MSCEIPIPWFLGGDRTITFGDQKIRLRRAEHRVMTYLVEQSPRPVTALELVAKVLEGNGDGAAARHQIFEIRRKLKRIRADHLVITDWGAGYRVSVEPAHVPRPSLP